jgi:hypothetical protein
LNISVLSKVMRERRARSKSRHRRHSWKKLMN